MALPCPVDKFSIQEPVHPIREALAKAGLSQIKFATLLGVSAMTLRYAINGEALKPSGVIAGMQALGHDPALVFEQYTAWRNWNRDRMLAVANAGIDTAPETQATREELALSAAERVGAKLAEVVRAVAERPSTADGRLRELEQWKASLVRNDEDSKVASRRTPERRVW